MTIIDGKKIGQEIRAEIAAQVADMVAAGKRAPHLAAVIVGHDGGSEAYVANKIKACRECGFESTTVRLDESVSQDQLLQVVNDLNNNPEIDGFIVQLPLPRHIDENRIIEAIDPSKDVDGFHPVNIGRMAIGLPCFVSATPAGIMELLSRSGIDPAGKECVVLGRSNIVGKPVATLLMQKARPGNATVTVCHSATPDLASHTRRADILISAMGKPGFVTADMVKPGAVVIDVGTTRIADPTAKNGSRIAGDVDFEGVAPKCAAITPVPGGVGPMTIVALLQNTLKAARNRQVSF